MTWFLTADEGVIRTITLNRPERKNAVPPDGWSQLRQAFVDFEESRQRVLIITGAGDAFCSGADLDPSRVDSGVVASRRRMKVVGDAALTLHRLTKPTLAVVNGVAAGAGMNLALGCDLVIATPSARFTEIFVKRGLTVDFGGTWHLPRLVGLQRAKELALTGRIIDAREALAIGLVLEIVEETNLEERLRELTGALASGAPVAQMFTKQGLNRSFHTSLAQAVADEGQSQAICLQSEDAAEGVSAFLDRRPAVFRGR
jgi:2-(1,2-epoxy-1,2-dihydrophenyl)acetyl-CoA isomerase